MPLRERITSGMVRCWITDGMFFTSHFNVVAAASMRAARASARARVDGLQGLGPDHHPGLHDVPGVIAADDVEAVDVFTNDGRLELEHGDSRRALLVQVVGDDVDRRHLALAVRYDPETDVMLRRAPGSEGETTSRPEDTRRLADRAPD